MRIGILAGEASGDLLGAKLMRALQAEYPNIQFEGIGGPAMIAAGCTSLFDIERLSVMGFIEPLMRLPDLFKLRSDLLKYFRKRPPDVFIGIDSPDFTIGLEKKLRQANIPVVHYVSPSVWAWRRYRIHKIARAVNLMLTLLPFEEKFYQQHGVPVQYVGHPLAEQIPLKPDKIAARRALCIEENATYIALLPGSRKQELYYMSAPFLLAAKLIYRDKPGVRFITSHVNEKRYQEFYDAYQQHAPELPLHFFTRRSQDVIAAADVVAVTSGTATLETMLNKKPMVIAYRMSKLTNLLAKWLIKIPYAGLPNLLADELLVPELIQSQVTPENIAEKLNHFLNHPQVVADLEDKFTNMHKELHYKSAKCMVKAILEVANHKP